MTPQEEIQQVKKVLDLNKDNWSIKGMYFNPSNVENFIEASDLKRWGFSTEVHDVESESGNVIKAAIIAPNKVRLELGSILLDGKDLIIQEDLRTFEDISIFVANNIPREEV